MRLEDIAPGQVLEGIAPLARAHVLRVDEPAPDTVAVVYRDASGKLGERLLCRADEPSIHVPARHRPWAFDADGEAFKRALETCRMPLPMEGEAGTRERMEAFVLLGRGAFLVDPSLPGLGPCLMLVLGPVPGACPGTGVESALVLVRAQPGGRFSMADSMAHRRLLPTKPEDRPLLNEVLRPLLADTQLRRAALGWFTASMIPEQAHASAPSPSLPPQALTPPILYGAAVVVPGGFLPWLRKADPAAHGIPR
jgi:hypothetical protein